jgi:hypothetical protein
MPQLFRRGANVFAKVSILGGVFILVAVVYVFNLLYKGPYVNEENVIREQPIPFSHKHHAKELGIDCRYCHTSAENSSFAGMPPTSTCMTCHSQIWNQSPTLEPVRDAYRNGTPIKWSRVNSLPDYVYFDHSIHVAKGIGCTTCHGPVGEMPLMWRQASLEMKWCLECHRNPERFVRSREAVFSLDWQPPADQKTVGGKLLKEYHVKKLTDCTECHR